jgi:TolB protein
VPTITPSTPTIAPTDTLPPPLSPTPTQTLVPPPVEGSIAFESNRAGNPGIFAFNSADSSVSPLSISNGTDSQPVYSPDGSLIAFTSNRDGNNEIYLMNANGSGQVNLTINAAMMCTQPGHRRQWIGFTTNRDGNQEIYVIRTDRSEIRNVSNNLAADNQPTWLDNSGIFSSDDEHIAFTSNRDGNQRSRQGRWHRTD